MSVLRSRFLTTTISSPYSQSLDDEIFEGQDDGTGELDTPFACDCTLGDGSNELFRLIWWRTVGV